MPLDDKSLTSIDQAKEASAFCSTTREGRFKGCLEPPGGDTRNPTPGTS